ICMTSSLSETSHFSLSSFFFFYDTTPTATYTLSLHDALPISSKRFVTTGTRTVKSRSRWKPHVKWKSPSWEKVGRAVAGILPVEAANMPRVEKTELYETKAPPGKSGGAVSGAAP